MIVVNMHEAKTRLSELVRQVEERNEVLVVCRDGQEVAEIRRRSKRRHVRDLTPAPRFKAEYAPGYRPVEPLGDDPHGLRGGGTAATAPRSVRPRAGGAGARVRPHDPHPPTPTSHAIRVSTMS
jgi:antitoxin (DNA-binding transcriptional repressor) of toxin-antitoxin stability system